MDEATFDQHVETWRRLPGTEKAAYYEHMLWPEVQRRFATHAKPTQRYDVLIIPVSNPYTVMLHLQRYRPAIAVLLHTAYSRAQCAERLRAECHALDIRCDDGNEDVGPDDPITMYRAVKHVYERYSGSQFAVDVTGGTKVMSTSAVMAGSIIGADTIYIESRFDRSIQDRGPGSEVPHRLPDPYVTLGDIQRQRAFDAYAAHDYATAQTLFGELAERVQPPQGDAHWCNLACAYRAWDAFDFVQAEEQMRELTQMLDDEEAPHQLRHAAAKLKMQQQVLHRIVAVAHNAAKSLLANVLQDTELVYAFLGSLYANAMRREAQGRYDVAALLLYRCLELISQRRLSAYGIHTHKPRYGKAKSIRPHLQDRYEEMLRRLGRTKWFDLPERAITLFVGYVLLEALEDELVQGYDIARIEQTSDARNHSILAHGLRLITHTEYEAFRAVVDDLLERLFIVEHRSRQQWNDTFTFITAEQST